MDSYKDIESTVDVSDSTLSGHIRSLGTITTAPKLAWFQDVESMLNHHLTGLLGLARQERIRSYLLAALQASRIAALCPLSISLHL
ncbi:hypothetical protein Syun_016487 [Stephania yunnanensis]|uniref:Uncharacterized protein n=1 Tax=Stephania yunnanensis TaxID=152371 RepID=A0AAP0P3Y7_9MAGN